MVFLEWERLWLGGFWFFGAWGCEYGGFIVWMNLLLKVIFKLCWLKEG